MIILPSSVSFMTETRCRAHLTKLLKCALEQYLQLQMYSSSSAVTVLEKESKVLCETIHAVVICYSVGLTSWCILVVAHKDGSFGFHASIAVVSDPRLIAEISVASLPNVAFVTLHPRS